MAMRVEGTRIYSDATWEPAEMSFSVVNSVYATLYSNTALDDFLAVTIQNETDQGIYATFDDTKDEHYLKPVSELNLALGNLQRKQATALKVRARSTLPTVGFVRAELLKR